MAEKLRRLRQVRLVQECTQLQPSVEQAMAEEFFGAEPEWPEYLEEGVSKVSLAGRQALLWWDRGLSCIADG